MSCIIELLLHRSSSKATTDPLLYVATNLYAITVSGLRFNGNWHTKPESYVIGHCMYTKVVPLSQTEDVYHIIYPCYTVSVTYLGARLASTTSLY